MFSNSGSKLKVIAQVLFVVEVIASVVGGIFLMIPGDWLLGISVIVGGFFVAWFGCLLLTALADAAMARSEQRESEAAVNRRLNGIEHKIDLMLDELALLRTQHGRFPKKEAVPAEEYSIIPKDSVFPDEAAEGKGKKKDKHKDKK